MRIWVNTDVIKKYLVEFKSTIPYYGDNKSYPPVQESCIIGENILQSSLCLAGPFSSWQPFSRLFQTVPCSTEGNRAFTPSPSSPATSMAACWHSSRILLLPCQMPYSMCSLLILNYHSLHGQAWEDTRDRRGKEKKVRAPVTQE